MKTLLHLVIPGICIVLSINFVVLSAANGQTAFIVGPDENQNIISTTELQQGQIPATVDQPAANRRVVVAVLDTGIDTSHVELVDRVINSINFTDSPVNEDIYGHGTYISGIIAGKNTGIFPDCYLLNVKVADDNGKWLSANLASGIVWAVDNGANIINISLEIGTPSEQLKDAVNYAWDKGVLIIAAAGNDGKSSPVYPAYYEHCLAVSAVKPDGTLVPLSNYGNWVDIAAPGWDIYSTLPGNEYGIKSGTSVATAYVSGVAAKLWSIASDVNSDNKLNDDVLNAIETGADSSSILTVGILDPQKSLAIAGLN